MPNEVRCGTTARSRSTPSRPQFELVEADLKVPGGRRLQERVHHDLDPELVNVVSANTSNLEGEPTALKSKAEQKLVPAQLRLRRQ